MDCPEPMPQGDEYACPKCPIRWGRDEERPVCVRQRLARKKVEMVSLVEPKAGKRFLAFGGYVSSPRDGGKHYIPAQKIPELYGVDPAECVFYKDGMREADYRELMHLGPLNLGDYKGFLDRAKVEQFHDYVKQRKLVERNSARPEGRHLAPMNAKRVAMYEARWPEFPEAFKRWQAR